MANIEQGHTREEYRIFLLSAEPGRLFAYWDGLSWRLPTIGIPTQTRPAEELQQAIQDSCGVNVFILDLLDVEFPRGHCVVAVVRSHQVPACFTAVLWEQIAEEEFKESHKVWLRAILSGERGPLSKPCWIEEAMAWVQSEVSNVAVQSDGIRQYNASGGFALLRFAIPDGRICWLKATGAPNRHEFDVTCLLAKIYPVALPSIIASRRDWNAWLMEDAGRPLGDQARLPMLEAAAFALASLQRACLTRCKELLEAGALDSGLGGLRNCIPDLIEYLSLAMEHQVSTKVSRLSKDRLLEIGQLLKNACDALGELYIPETVVHKDINPSNILYNGPRCVIIDWAEAGVGNPFLAFEHLSLLTSCEAERQILRDVYRYCWSDILTNRQIDRAFRLEPLVAIAFYLYGRGDWLASPSRNNPIFERCARSLARHMDRVARTEEVRKSICA